jgi:hypothetical protein
MIQHREILRPAFAISGLFLLSRALLLLVGFLAIETIDGGINRASGDSLAALFCRWDCSWYVRIAERGYLLASDPAQPGATDFAYFPLYPMVVRATAMLSGMSALHAALWVSNFAFLVALGYVYRYARAVGSSENGALIAVALLCFSPQGFVFSAGYTESLFLLLLAMSMFYMRRGNYLAAGLAAAALSAVRANGIFFLLFAVAWLLQAYGWRSLLRPWQRPERYVPIVLAPLGLFLFWLWCFQETGDAFAQMSSLRHGWGWQAGPFFENLLGHSEKGTNERFWMVSSLVIGLVSLRMLWYSMRAEWAMCIGILLLLWSGQIANSLLRYSIVLFPVWIALARDLESRPKLMSLVFAAVSIINGFLMTAWTLGKMIAI